MRTATGNDLESRSYVYCTYPCYVFSDLCQNIISVPIRQTDPSYLLNDGNEGSSAVRDSFFLFSFTVLVQVPRSSYAE